jgi:L-rhamnose mutarotase
MEHIMYIQKVKEGKKEEYINAHKNCWQDLLIAMHKSGIKREIIWMHKNLILIYVMAENFKESMEIFSKTAIFKKWLNKMETLLDEVQDYTAGENIKCLEKIFDLEKQLEL